MDTTQAHWDRVYRTKETTATSWFRPHLELSLDLIAEARAIDTASIIDVGGGESTLVDDALARGCTDFTVLDIADPAMRRSRARLGDREAQVHWLIGDITTVVLTENRYDVWHDRAVFHFLVHPGQRAAYRSTLLRCLRPGGHVVIATFGPDGPLRCSGLEIVRYDAASLAAELGAPLRLERSQITVHRTSAGAEQQFMYCRFGRP